MNRTIPASETTATLIASLRRVALEDARWRGPVRWRSPGRWRGPGRWRSPGSPPAPAPWRGDRAARSSDPRDRPQVRRRAWPGPPPSHPPSVSGRQRRASGERPGPCRGSARPGGPASASRPGSLPARPSAAPRSSGRAGSDRPGWSSPKAASIASGASSLPVRRSVNATSSRTVGRWSSAPGFCGRYAVRPSGRRTVPASGGISPASVRSSVVLPEPFGPTSATTSPRPPARETSWSTGTLVGPAVTPSNSTPSRRWPRSAARRQLAAGAEHPPSP